MGPMREEAADVREEFLVKTVHALGTSHGSIDGSAVLGDLRERVCRLGGNPFTMPYVPFVGPEYRPGGVLVYATAQNLAGAADEPLPTESDALFRLWGGDAPISPIDPPKNLGIAPWDEGLLVAVTGMLLLARDGHALSLSAIRRRTAVSNYFKHSLVEPGRKGGRDLNPNRLDWSDARKYAELTWKHYVEAEIVALAPSVIVCLPGVQQEILRDSCDRSKVDVVVVNDPAWVKRGMSGVAREGGSWRRAADQTTEEERALARKYVEQCAPYWDGKRAAAETYLLQYLRTWRRG